MEIQKRIPTPLNVLLMADLFSNHHHLEHQVISIPVIDTHQHLWDPTQLNIPWLDSNKELNQRFLMADYLKMTASPTSDYRIEKTIYMEADVAEEEVSKEVDWAIKICTDPLTPLSGVIASARPGTDSFLAQLEESGDSPHIVGFRQVLHTDQMPAGYCLQAGFLADLDKLSSHCLPFDICIRSTELHDAFRLIHYCPQTQFVLDHCGNVDLRFSSDEFQQWKKEIHQIASLPNVVCKVSGFIWTIQDRHWTYEKEIQPVLEEVFTAFGEDRLLFGGDWPVCTLSRLTFPDWMAALQRFAETKGSTFCQKLFSENAETIYGV